MFRRVLDEAALLTRLSHKNIAKILGLCVQPINNQIKLGKFGVIFLST